MKESDIIPDNLRYSNSNNFDSIDGLEISTETLSKVELRNNLIRQIRKMESIFIYNPDLSVNIERTKAERVKVIESQELDKITELDDNYRIVEDESGLPVLEVK